MISEDIISLMDSDKLSVAITVLIEQLIWDKLDSSVRSN